MLQVVKSASNEEEIEVSIQSGHILSHFINPLFSFFPLQRFGVLFTLGFQMFYIKLFTCCTLHPRENWSIRNKVKL